jgi:acyl dehydratase
VVYAAAVGADPDADVVYLDLSRGPEVLPTFLGARLLREGQKNDFWGPWDLDPHATFTLSCDLAFHHRAPSTHEGDAGVETVVTKVWDKGSSVVVVTEFEVTVAGQRVCSGDTTMMVRGRGGFGGERGPSRTVAPALDGAVDLDIHLPPNSAALYQLVGEHNPHSLDPAFAAEMGLPGPISAGQLLMGAAARTVTAAFAAGDHGALSRIAVEFAGPHVIGRPLTMQAQASGSGVIDFAVHSGDQPVLVGGRAELA